jgi:hypothetical protein
MGDDSSARLTQFSQGTALIGPTSVGDGGLNLR